VEIGNPHFQTHMYPLLLGCLLLVAPYHVLSLLNISNPQSPICARAQNAFFLPKIPFSLFCVPVTFPSRQPRVVELQRSGDELRTDVEGIRTAIDALGADHIAAVMTTTSCFAPR
jgi:hypothetical protein